MTERQRIVHRSLALSRVVVCRVMQALDLRWGRTDVPRPPLSPRFATVATGPAYRR
jgi:hypothetical protein